MSCAWEVTAADVEKVLRDNGISKTDEEIEEIHGNLDFDRIEDAVLGYIDFDDQCNASNREIREILVEEGIIPE